METECESSKSLDGVCPTSEQFDSEPPQKRMKVASSSHEAECGLCKQTRPLVGFCRHCDQFMCDECEPPHKRLQGVFSGHKVVKLQDLSAAGTSSDGTALAGLASSNMYKIGSSHEAECGLCKQTRSLVGFCRHCDRFMCDECEISHKRLQGLFSGHEVVCLQAAGNSDSDENSTTALAGLAGNDIYEIDSSMKVSLVAPAASLEDVTATLRRTVNCDVAPKGEGTYSISIPPRVRGRHDLIVRVKNEEITGSPFRVLVKIPPSQLGQDVRKIVGVNRPWGIAINNKQQLVVAEYGGNKITIMERDGKKVQTIECAEFKEPRGVAAAVDGAIYVTDSGAQCLFKFNSEGKLLKTVCNELQTPHSVKIIQNQLYVVDNAKKLVKIFDMECNVVGAIQIKECPDPMDIAEGPDGLLYVAGQGKISVYSHDGVFIHHLNLQPSSLKLRGICFDSAGHIIASDCNKGVYAFQPSGECVSHVASGGVIWGPAGVTVDDDGFVYVCEFHSNKVIVL